VSLKKSHYKGRSRDSFKVEVRHSNKSDETSENGSCMPLKKSSYKEQNHEASKAKGDCFSKSDKTIRNGGLNVEVHTKNAEKKVKQNSTDENSTKQENDPNMDISKSESFAESLS
jgi:hypothetical protein